MAIEKVKIVFISNSLKKFSFDKRKTSSERDVKQGGEKVKDAYTLRGKGSHKRV